jgi:hypothetical protein
MAEDDGERLGVAWLVLPPNGYESSDLESC